MNSFPEKTSVRCGPDPSVRYPLENYSKLGFLKNFTTDSRIIVGDYTYFSNESDEDEKMEEFEKRNVLYFSHRLNVRLIIGRFCAIATGVRFLMSGGNHDPSRISTYPLGVFKNGWENAEIASTARGDTVVGNDVWFGYNAIMMPGIHIGDGAVIGCGAVVTKNVEPYTVVAGNPAEPIRKRFDDDSIQKLLQIRWWDWDIEKITRNVHIISQGDVEKLLRCE